MFAGPNGSGKTTLFRALSKEHSVHGVFRGEPFVNADEIEHELRETGGVDLRRYWVSLIQPDVERWFADGRWTVDAGGMLRVNGTRLDLSSASSPYTAAAIAGLLRERMLIAGRSFSFETVMSHSSKVDFLHKARGSGYRTYLYFVATDAVELNVRRGEVRERSGGHAVPEQNPRTLRSLFGVASVRFALCGSCVPF
jgi:predicted ABC-type ATPase